MAKNGSGESDAYQYSGSSLDSGQDIYQNDKPSQELKTPDCDTSVALASDDLTSEKEKSSSIAVVPSCESMDANDLGIPDSISEDNAPDAVPHTDISNERNDTVSPPKNPSSSADLSNTIDNNKQPDQSKIMIDLSTSDPPSPATQFESVEEDLTVLKHSLKPASTVLPSKTIELLMEPFKLGFTRSIVFRKSDEGRCDVYYNFEPIFPSNSSRLRSLTEVDRLLASLCLTDQRFLHISANENFCFRRLLITPPPHTHECVIRSAGVKHSKPSKEGTSGENKMAKANSSPSEAPSRSRANRPGPRCSKQGPISDDSDEVKILEPPADQPQTVLLTPDPASVSTIRAIKRKCPPSLLRTLAPATQQQQQGSVVVSVRTTRKVRVIERASEEFLVKRYPEWDKASQPSRRGSILSTSSLALSNVLSLEDVPNSQNSDIPPALWSRPCSRFCLPDGSPPGVVCVGCHLLWHTDCVARTTAASTNSATEAITQKLKEKLFLCPNCLTKFKTKKSLEKSKKVANASTNNNTLKKQTISMAMLKSKNLAIVSSNGVHKFLPMKGITGTPNLRPKLLLTPSSFANSVSSSTVQFTNSSTTLALPPLAPAPHSRPPPPTESSLLLDSPFSILYATDSAVCMELPNTSLSTLGSGNVLITLPKVPGLERILEQRLSYLRVNMRTYAVEPRNIGHFDSVYKILLPDPPTLTNPNKMTVVLTSRPADCFPNQPTPPNCGVLIPAAPPHPLPINGFGGHSQPHPGQGQGNSCNKRKSPMEISDCISVDSCISGQVGQGLVKQRHVKMQVKMSLPTPDPFILDFFPSPMSRSLLGLSAMDAILRKLPAEDLSACRGVCRQWRRLIDSFQLWDRVWLASSSRVVNWSSLSTFLSRRHTRRLEVQLTCSPNPECNRGPAIEACLQQLATGPSLKPPPIIRLCGSLVSLSLVAEFFPLFEVEVVSLPTILSTLVNLRHLKLRSSSSLQFSLSGIDLLDEQFPLEILELDVSQDFHLLQFFDPIKFPKLHTIILDDCVKWTPQQKFSSVHIRKLVLKFSDLPGHGPYSQLLTLFPLVEKLENLVLVASFPGGHSFQFDHIKRLIPKDQNTRVEVVSLGKVEKELTATLQEL